MLATGWGDGTIRLWDVATRKNVTAFVTPKAESNPEETILIRSVAFSPDAKTVASGNTGSTSMGMIRLWDVASGKNTASFRGSTSPFVIIPGIYCVVFSPDGNTLATGHEDNVIRLWDVASGKIVAKFEVDSGDLIYSVAFSPDGKTLASGGKEGTIKLWNVVDGRNKATFKDGNDLKSLVFSPDGKTLAAGVYQKGVILWDVASGKNVATFKVVLSKYPHYPYDMTYSVAFSPAGRTLAEGRTDGIIALWDLSSGKRIAIFNGHTSVVRSLAFSPDGTTLASGSDDSTVKLWDLVAAPAKKTEYRQQEVWFVTAAGKDGKSKSPAIGDSWHINVELDMPGPEPQAVQYAILDSDPVPRFEGHLRHLKKVFAEQAGKGGQSKQLREDRTANIWDIGFSDVRGDQLWLLTKFLRGGLGSTLPAGKKWIVTKIVHIDGKPVCWCIPVEVKKGGQINVALNQGNTFDLKAAYDKVMREPVAAGEGKSRRQNADKTILECQRALQQNPEDADAHCRLAAALAALGRSDEALAQVRKSLQLKPDSAEAHYQLGVILASLGRFEEASAALPQSPRAEARLWGGPSRS